MDPRPPSLQFLVHPDHYVRKEEGGEREREKRERGRERGEKGRRKMMLFIGT